MTENKHVPPVPQTFRDSIKSAAASLAPPQTTEVPTTMEVDKPDPAQLSDPKVVDKNIEEKEELKNDEPIIEVDLKQENKAAEAAKETITSEKKIEDFEFDDDTKSFLNDIYKEEDNEEKEVESPELKRVSAKRIAEIEDKYKPYMEKATEYESVLNDPLTKAFIEFRKSGGNDPNEFIKQTGVVDIEGMTPEQLIEVDMKNSGLTPDEITDEMERFKELSTYEKKKLTKSVKDDLSRTRDEKLKAFTGKSEQGQRVYQEAIKRGTQELDSVIQTMEGKKYKGLLITPEMAKSIRQDVMRNSVPRLDEKGQFIGFDISESIRRAVILNYDEQRSKSLIEIGKTIGADKTLTARIRPNKKEAGTAVIPITQKTVEDAGRAVSDRFWKKRGVKTK